MKLFKKVLSVAAVLALVVTMVPAKAKAATDVIDFEDGNIPAGIVMATMNDDGVTPDGDPALLSVVDYNGSKMLKVAPQANGIPKVKFFLADLVGADNVANVGGIEYDLIVENTTGAPAGYVNGTIGAGAWGAAGGWSNGGPGGGGFVIEEYTNAATALTHMKDTILPGLGFADSKGAFMFMNWATTNVLNNYIDNIQILDKDGNPMPLVVGAAEEAATDDAAATDVPKTGVVGFGIVYGLGALATGAFALRRKQK